MALRRSLITVVWLAGLACCGASAWAQPHVLRNEKLTCQFTPEQGLRSVTLGQEQILTGTSTAFGGALFTLTRDVPLRDWNWPENRDTCHFAPSMGRLVAKLGPGAPRQTRVLEASATRYVVQYRLDAGVTLTFAHELQGPDLTLRVTVENDSIDSFQLHDWLALNFDFHSPTQHVRRMSSYYPAANVYSPVTAAWGAKAAVGFNWVEHQSRPVEIRFHPQAGGDDAPRWHSKIWLKNSPVEPGGRTHYTLVLRLDDTPGNWRHLLTPYQQWFRSYFGPVQYALDFRMKAASFASNLDLAKPDNPRGFRYGLDRMGWQPYLDARLKHLPACNVGEVIIWGVTGADPRGVNYRPEFNVLPPAVLRTMPLLADFCQRGKMRFGFFARPNTIAYQRSAEEDGDVEWNPLDGQHEKMADERFKELFAAGARAFYLDTYGSSVGCEPGSVEGRIRYLKRLREKVGPDPLIVTEHGWDALHLFACIWPSGEDELGKRPLGEYVRWLSGGTVEICRAFSAAGAERAWREGGIPILNDSDINRELARLQSEYVHADGSSRVREDCWPLGRFGQR